MSREPDPEDSQKGAPSEPDQQGVPLSPRTRHLLALEFGDLKDFDDPSLEWRRLFSELLGTFFLVLVAAGGGLLHAKGQISLPFAVVAPGLMVMAIILFMGAVSGAHLNPAVSFAFALRGDFESGPFLRTGFGQRRSHHLLGLPGRTYRRSGYRGRVRLRAARSRRQHDLPGRRFRTPRPRQSHRTPAPGTEARARRGRSTCAREREEAMSSLVPRQGEAAEGHFRAAVGPLPPVRVSTDSDPLRRDYVRRSPLVQPRKVHP